MAFPVWSGHGAKPGADPLSRETDPGPSVLSVITSFITLSGRHDLEPFGFYAGGAIYEAILAHCALKAKAKVIYTWNTKDFLRLPRP